MTNWLPPDKQAAICFTIDDIHPGRATDSYEAGGDLDAGALGRVSWLLERHSHLRVTLFTTADWRETSPVPTRRVLSRIPVLRNRCYLAKPLAAGTMSLDRHPAFVAYLRDLSKAEIALHGLSHIHRGSAVPVEFQDHSSDECKKLLSKALVIFETAELPFVRGLSPPGWNLSDELAIAMIELGFDFVTSARDIRTPISSDAKTNMSGLKNASLLYPEYIRNGQLVHIPTNFQATSTIDRALAIIENAGLLSIKAHIVKDALGHIALDGIDALYTNYLDLLFSALEDRYGDKLWWTSMGQIARTMAKSNFASSTVTGPGNG
jgi:predicted deacetylase